MKLGYNLSSRLLFLLQNILQFQCHSSYIKMSGSIQKVRNGKGVGGYQHIPLRQAKIASFFPTKKRDKGGRGV